MSNMVQTLNAVKDIQGQYDVVSLGGGANAYIVNCTAHESTRFNDPAEAGFYISFVGMNHAYSPKYPDFSADQFSFRCMVSLLPNPEPDNPIAIDQSGKIESIRVHFPLNHTLAESLLPQGHSAFKPFELYDYGWQMPLTGEVRRVADSVWSNDYQGASRALWMQGKIYELLALLMVHKEPDSLAERACEMISRQPHLNWNISRLARALATNECYLKQAFREQFNMGVARWIQSHRIELAKERLATADQTITQIALDLGYQSGSYFSKVFKQQTSITPKEFRNQYVILND